MFDEEQGKCSKKHFIKSYCFPFSLKSCSKKAINSERIFSLKYKEARGAKYSYVAVGDNWDSNNGCKLFLIRLRVACRNSVCLLLQRVRASTEVTLRWE